MSLNNFGGLSFRQGMSNPSNNVLSTAAGGVGGSGVGTILNEQSAASIINASSNNKQYFTQIQNQGQSINSGVIGSHDNSTVNAA